MQRTKVMASGERLVSGLEILRTLVHLKKEGEIDGVTIKVLSGDEPSRRPRISPLFIQLFDLTPADSAKLNRALDDASRQVNDLIRAATTSHREDNGQKIVVETPPFPDAGGKVHDQLRRAFSTALGPEQRTLFDEFSEGTQLEGLDDWSGLEDEKLTISRSTDCNGSVIYSALRENKGPGWHTSSPGRFLSKASLEATYPRAAPFLPAGY